MPAQKAIVSGLSGRYATALFELAHERGTLEAVEGDMNALAALLEQSAEFRRLVKTPLLKRAQQGAAAAKVVQEMELSDITGNFLGVLAENRRLNALSGIIRDFRALLAQHKGEVTAKVVSAKPLNDTQMKALTAKLKQIAGRDVSIDARVDKALIGGLVVRIGSRMIDGSIATKLGNLERAMKGV